MVSNLTREQVGEYARLTIDLVEKFGFKWEFDYEYPLPDLEKRVQIREQKNLAPTAMVTNLKAQMKRGEKLPPVIVTKDGHLVDGNTRVTAALALGFPAIQAVVLDADYEGGSEAERRRLHGLGAAANAKNGKGINRNELRDAVEHLATDPAYTATRIAALIGVTERTVQDLVAEKKGRDRAEALGIHINGSFSGTQLRALGRAEGLNDEPYKELVTLVADTGMGAAEIKTVLTAAKETKSDSGALKVLAKEKESRSEQAAEFKASGKSKPPASAKLRQRLGFILNFEKVPQELLEHNPTLSKEYIDQLERSIIVLQHIVKAQGR